MPFATIAFDSASSQVTTGYDGGPRTISWSHTCSGSQRLLVVCVAIWQDVATYGTVTSCTYNSVGLSDAPDASYEFFNMRSEIWYYTNPPTGTHTVSVTVGDATDAVKAAALSFTGIDQYISVASSTYGGAGSDNPAFWIDTSVQNSLVVGGVSKYGTTAITPSTFTNGAEDHASDIILSADYIVTTSTGTYTNDFTGGASSDWAMSLVEFKPFPIYPFAQTPNHFTFGL